ncbi:hypothetical protein ACFE04_018576 [Oxalis oulophora]
MNTTSTSTDLTVLERQRARFKSHQDEEQETSYFSELNSVFYGFAAAAGYEQMNYASISRTSSCPPPSVATAAVKKRKTLKAQNPKAVVVGEDECMKKRIKSSTEEEESKITEHNNSNRKENSGSETSKASDVQKTDYIHVRARRGQATDSHSLAERVRREKISERMKFLQDIVPGCNKIIGKAGMLDEIINYVQSLQRQVEFLSMKLAAVNPRLDFDIDSLFAKEVFPSCTSNFQSMGMSSSELTNAAYLQFNPVEQVVSCCGLDMGINPSDMALRRTISAPIPAPETFIDSSCFPIPSLNWDSDLQNLNNVTFDQGRPTSLVSQSFSGSIEAGNLKMEM